jgi:hypothetical protein
VYSIARIDKTDKFQMSASLSVSPIDPAHLARVSSQQIVRYRATWDLAHQTHLVPSNSRTSSSASHQTRLLAIATVTLSTLLRQVGKHWLWKMYRHPLGPSNFPHPRINPLSAFYSTRLLLFLMAHNLRLQHHRAPTPLPLSL